MAENDGGSSSGPPVRPTISLPPRTPTMESMFAGGVSPGPMTLVSSFFNDSDSDCRSFSQLLAGAMASPATSMRQRPQQNQQQATENYGSGGGGKESGNGGGGVDFRFQQNRPPDLTVSQQQAVFTVPPGLSPASLLDSPGFFSSAQGSFGFSHQQALAQITAQITQAPSQMHVSTDQYSSFSSAPPRSSSQIQPHSSGTMAPQQMRDMRPPRAETSIEKEASDVSYPDLRSQLPMAVDKPADDGYNWRKYGQKQVKGSEYPRSYYKCTHTNCPVKKKVERSLEGQVTEIIYKGHHNHQPPQGNKRAKDAENAIQGNSESGPVGGYNSHSLSMKDQEFSQATQEQTCGSSESEEVGNAGNGAEGKDEDEPESKRRNMEVMRSSGIPSNHRTVTEPRIIVQTTSEVDLLDDGYRWRKYGQKVVKGNPYPRSYYKCTSQGCNVRKHVERAASDPKAVITTYEGKHTHDVPAAKNSSHATANMISQLRSQNNAPNNHSSAPRAEFRNNGRQGIASLRFKEEQMT